MIKDYYRLAKPGIIYGNAITAAAGFFLASKGHFYAEGGSAFGGDIKLFLAMIVGLSLVIASGCVFNNLFDSDVDAKMDRTKNRAMVTGVVSKTAAIIYGIALLIVGTVILWLLTTHYSLLTALIGWIFYVLIYTPLKRSSVYATIIGSIAGAVPPVVGYTAVANRLDAGALILFLILVLWQMPHFYAIAIYRLKDYTEASIPVLPVKQGIQNTKIQMLIYIIFFIIAAASLTYYGYTRYLYLAVTVLLGLAWLRLAIQGFKTADNTAWAKKMFRFSLIVITLLCVIIPIDVFLRY